MRTPGPLHHHLIPNGLGKIMQMSWGIPLWIWPLDEGWWGGASLHETKDWEGWGCFLVLSTLRRQVYYHIWKMQAKLGRGPQSIIREGEVHKSCRTWVGMMQPISDLTSFTCLLREGWSLTSHGTRVRNGRPHLSIVWEASRTYDEPLEGLFWQYTILWCAKGWEGQTWLEWLSEVHLEGEQCMSFAE